MLPLVSRKKAVCLRKESKWSNAITSPDREGDFALSDAPDVSGVSVRIMVHVSVGCGCYWRC